MSKVPEALGGGHGNPGWMLQGPTISHPTSKQVRQARLAANLTQSKAAALMGSACYRTWQGYEVQEGSDQHRKIPMSTWELFLLRTGQHPTHTLRLKNEACEVS